MRLGELMLGLPITEAIPARSVGQFLRDKGTERAQHISSSVAVAVWPLAHSLTSLSLVYHIHKIED